jgi:hypothetical protein
MTAREELRFVDGLCHCEAYGNSASSHYFFSFFCLKEARRHIDPAWAFQWAVLWFRAHLFYYIICLEHTESATSFVHFWRFMVFWWLAAVVLLQCVVSVRCVTRVHLAGWFAVGFSNFRSV